MDELVEKIIILSHELEDINNRLFHTKDYIDALHDGRADYTVEKERLAKAQYKETETKQNKIINELKSILK